MNQSQLNKLVWLTNKIARDNTRNGGMAFKVVPMHGEYMFQAWNERDHWFESTLRLTGFIGKRGGFKVYEKEGYIVY